MNFGPQTVATLSTWAFIGINVADNNCCCGCTIVYKQAGDTGLHPKIGARED